MIEGLMTYSAETECVSMWVPIVADLKPMISEISTSAINDALRHHKNSGDDSDDAVHGVNGRNQLAYEYVLFASFISPSNCADAELALNHYFYHHSIIQILFSAGLRRNGIERHIHLWLSVTS